MCGVIAGADVTVDEAIKVRSSTSLELFNSCHYLPFPPKFLAKLARFLSVPDAFGLAKTALAACWTLWPLLLAYAVNFPLFWGFILIGFFLAITTIAYVVDLALVKFKTAVTPAMTAAPQSF